MRALTLHRPATLTLQRPRAFCPPTDPTTTTARWRLSGRVGRELGRLCFPAARPAGWRSPGAAPATTATSGLAARATTATPTSGLAARTTTTTAARGLCALADPRSAAAPALLGGRTRPAAAAQLGAREPLAAPATPAAAAAATAVAAALLCAAASARGHVYFPLVSLAGPPAAAAAAASASSQAGGRRELPRVLGHPSAPAAAKRPVRPGRRPGAAVGGAA